jgi:flagellin-specific chaperone FliS
LATSPISLNRNRVRRVLNGNEQKRVDRLEAILQRLRAGEHIQNRMLKAWLTADEFALLNDVWENQKLLRAELQNKPDEIKDYEEILRQALFAYSKADNHSIKGRHKTASKLMNEADRYFERVLEKAEEINATQPHLRSWFDRDLSQTDNSSLGLSPDLVPRVITSRSLIKQSSGLQGAIMNINEVKQYVINKALDDLLYSPNPSSKSKLDELLNGGDDDF